VRGFLWRVAVFVYCISVLIAVMLYIVFSWIFFAIFGARRRDGTPLHDIGTYPSLVVVLGKKKEKIDGA